MPRIDLADIPESLVADVTKLADFYVAASPSTESVTALVRELSDAQGDMERATAWRKFFVTLGKTAIGFAGVPLPPTT